MQREIAHRDGEQQGERGWDGCQSECDSVALPGQLVRQPRHRGSQKSTSSRHGLPQPCNQQFLINCWCNFSPCILLHDVHKLALLQHCSSNVPGLKCKGQMAMR